MRFNPFYVMSKTFLWPINNLLRKKEKVICSICRYLWCKYSLVADFKLSM